MTNTKLLLSVAAASILAFNGCETVATPVIFTEGTGGTGTTPTTGTTPVKGYEVTGGAAPTVATGADITGECNAGTTYAGTLSGKITTPMTLTSGNVYLLQGKVEVSGTTLTIEDNVTIAGEAGTGDFTSYLIINKDGLLKAQGTAAKPICFTSKTAQEGGVAQEGQWGGITLIGTEEGNDELQGYEIDASYVAGAGINDASIMEYVAILNSGITMAEDKEINGLSMVGVTGGTFNHILVDSSDDDCIELWGGAATLSNITVTNCTDDQFDIDDKYAGTVTNMLINQVSGNAGMEMSGTTHATFEGLTINVASSAKEGGIFFKKDGIGGNFNNLTLNYNVPATNTYGAIYSSGAVDPDNISFSNFAITANNLILVSGEEQGSIDILASELGI